MHYAYKDIEFYNRDAIREKLKDFDLKNTVAANLNFKQGIGELGKDYQKGNVNEYQKTIKHFFNVLNRETHGNKFKKHNCRLRTIVVLEKKDIGRWHTHMVIENPYVNRPQYFELLILNTWINTDWGYGENLITFNIDWGWIEYITKFKNPEDVFDWGNLHM
jgi:hypothetical protein